MSRETMPFGTVTLEVLRVMHERACERVRQLEQEVEKTKDYLSLLELRFNKQRELAYHLHGCIEHFNLLDDVKAGLEAEEKVGSHGPLIDKNDSGVSKQYWTEH